MAGNATVTLYDGSKLVNFGVWLIAFRTSSSNVFNEQQVRGGIARIPVRRAEMFAQFTIMWPVAPVKPKTAGGKDLGFEKFAKADGFARMNYFQDTISTHQQCIANGTTTQPMVLNYKNNSEPQSPYYNKLISPNPLKPLIYRGWIRTVEKEHARFKNTYVRNYTMNILTPNESNTPYTHFGTAKNLTYTPSPAGLSGSYPTDSWNNIADLASQVEQIENIP